MLYSVQIIIKNQKLQPVNGKFLHSRIALYKLKVKFRNKFRLNI